jgi:hypothetical protein
MFRPLSRRVRTDPRFDEPQAGLPDYLVEPVIDWVRPLLLRDDPSLLHAVPAEDRLRTLQLLLRLDVPLDWRNDAYSALDSLLTRMVEDRELALDVVDALVQLMASPEYANDLDARLRLGGSEWSVLEHDGSRALVRRAIGPVPESIEAIWSDSQRGHQHLMSAWRKLNGRAADPSGAYREAIKAVEAVAKPVISPDNARATLGTMIRDIRAKPDKWEFVLGGASVEDVAALADLLWKGHLDRHGSDDESVPLEVSMAEADTAVHLAVPIVRIFAAGLVSRR